MSVERLSILGSTGSIGVQTLDIVRRYPERFKVSSLVAHSRWEELAQQAREFDVESVVIGDERHYEALREALKDTRVEVMAGSEAINHVARSYRSDTLVNALVGYAGLHPTYLAIESGKRIALANKETLVVGGDIIMAAARNKGVDIMPIDSEHSAIMQCLEGEKRNAIRNLIITCSGGALRDIPREALESVTPEMALKHPQWSMGAKITIDSATLVNKGFEVIEARWLFDIEPERIKVVVHPQSIVHSLVQFTDGCLKAQLGAPDMRVPIQYALSYPERISLNTKRISLPELGQLTFLAPDRLRFPAIDLAYAAHRQGGNMACIMNGANEVAVAALLQEKILFGQIPHIIEKTMSRCSFIANPTISDIFETDACAKAIAAEFI
jgi:1-deoxy-D-xylulose-5-phosphate reductoisomerase